MHFLIFMFNDVTFIACKLAICHDRNIYTIAIGHVTNQVIPLPTPHAHRQKVIQHLQHTPPC